MLRSWLGPLSFHLCNNLGRLIQTAGLSRASSSSNPAYEQMITQGPHSRHMFAPSLAPDMKKNKSSKISPVRDAGWILLFSPLCPLSPVIHPCRLLCEYSSSNQLSVALPPCLTVWIGVQTITLLVSLYLPLCSPPSPSLTRSLSLSLTAEVCSAPPFLIGLL